jgi:hypothetical protein
VQEQTPPLTFFRDRYFPTDAHADVFNADKVLIEYRDGDRKLAPFVVKRKGDIPINRGGYEMNEYAPPYIKPSRLLTIDDLEERGFGEAILPTAGAEERATAIISRDLVELNDRITRTEEWLCAQTLIFNGFTATAYNDDGTKGEVFDLFYYKEGENNPTQYTISDPWDNGGDFYRDVELMCVDLQRRGKSAADLVIGSDVADYIQNDEKTLKRLDIARANFGNLEPQNLSNGVSWLGRLNFGGFVLDIFAVRETYEDESGTIQPYFPSKSVLVTAPGCGHLMYARVRQMNTQTTDFEDIALPRVPRVYIDTNNEQRKLRLAARPLAAPKTKAPWIYAANAVQ